MTVDTKSDLDPGKTVSPLAGPRINPRFADALSELVMVAQTGHRPESEYFNPSDEWLIQRMRIFQNLPANEQARVLEEYEQIKREAEQANAEGKAARRAGPDVVFRLDTGGLAFFSQLGVARRPDLTYYFIEGFQANRDALAFNEEHQELFADVFLYITAYLKEHFARGDVIVQMDRRICDVPERSYHARQLLVGTRYLQLPYMWRQLTFDLPEAERQDRPDIIELSIPSWLEDIPLPATLKSRIEAAGLTQLIFKAPTRGLSLHLGFDYMGEHKMGPLTIAMFKVKEKNGVALQAALSVARVRTLQGKLTNTAIVTTGPSLHGKSTLTIMLELAGSALAQKLGLADDPAEGVYPMNDDIILLQPMPEPVVVSRGDDRVLVIYGIDGTENNFYAVPFGLTREDDPITYEVLRGTPDAPNPQETLENVLVDPQTGRPDFLQNPTRNMRMILSRSRLLVRKRADHLLAAITNGRLTDAIHVPMTDVDRVFWQAVMRQNTVVPPLRRVRLNQYVRILMYGEAVQMGAAAGAIGKPYVEYFSDPFIIGLEDENANLLYFILEQMERAGQRQEFYVFNTGGIGAETNEQASGPRYKKIPRDLTLMLQEALLRGAVKFEHDPFLGSDLAVAIVNDRGEEVVNLRQDWLPSAVYGEDEYRARVAELEHRRYYGDSADDRAGVLRYTKVTDAILDIERIPPPRNERELAWLLSFYWHVDKACHTLAEVVEHRHEGMRPAPYILRALRKIYERSVMQGLDLPQESRGALSSLGIAERGERKM